MTIEYYPRGLKGVLTASDAKKRLRNREGYVTFQNTQGEKTRTPIEGSILDICKTAVEHNSQHPEDKIGIFEHSCGMSGLPNPLPKSKWQNPRN